MEQPFLQDETVSSTEEESDRKRPGQKQAGRGGGLSRDEIMEVLEQEIMAAQLKPGERLDERVLAARFGVSRAPVRDALGRLASLGLIEVRPRSGSYVAALNVRDMMELMEVMSGIEGLCAFHAARRASEAECEHLTQLAEQCRDAASRTTEEYIQVNNRFHDYIYECMRNKQLARLARQTRKRIDPYRHLALRVPGRRQEAAMEHMSILEALRAGDGLKALTLMRDHADIQLSDFAHFISVIESGAK